jgi:hypothetical protein
MINIFNHELKEDPSFSTKESELLLKINENKLEITERLKNALSIEDLTQQAKFSQYTLVDVKLEEGRKGKITFTANRQLLPENIEETSLCFIPMEKYNTEKFMFNKEQDCAFALIEKFVGNTVIFSRNKILDYSTKPFDTKLIYAVRFIPNRITIRASINALDLIHEKKLTGFFENFDAIPSKTNMIKFNKDKIFEEKAFEWCNKNIESNEEQKLAIKNIVNCTAYPYPYCVFGPPGKIKL